MAKFSFTIKPEHLDPPLTMGGVKYCQVALRPPFSATPPRADEWRLYLVRGDDVCLTAETLTPGPQWLQRGTVIGMSGAVLHAFTSANGAGAGPGALSTDWRETPLGTKTGADQVVIAMGRIPQSSKPFVSLLGQFIRIDPQDHRDAAGRIGALIDLIADETKRSDLGSDDIILRLAEIIAIHLRRVGHARSVLFGDGLRDAEYDPRIWRAIAAVSSEPHRRWTVESMAEVAGMSRSAFAMRYRDMVGQTPMRSLRRLRMHGAATTLASPGGHLIAPLAGAAGYGSDAAFNRAFAKEFGHPPRRYGLKTTPSGVGPRGRPE